FAGGATPRGNERGDDVVKGELDWIGPVHRDQLGDEGGIPGMAHVLSTECEKWDPAVLTDEPETRTRFAHDDSPAVRTTADGKCKRLGQVREAVANERAQVL